ncbi:MAG: hypothetical protein WAM39_03870 [Bryobacteraceae bacterium]
MFGNAAHSEVLEQPQFVSLKIVLSAQAIGELTALSYPAHPLEFGKRELAGFLFGKVSQRCVQVETVRQLPSETGSLIFERFTNKEFGEILRASQADESLAGLAIVGWYRFHPARDLRLEPAEIDFHEKFFPNHEHVGLILRPDEPSGLTALICARSQDGAFSRTQHASAALSVNSRRIARAAVELQSGPKFGEEAYIQAYRILESGDERTSRRKWIVAAALVGTLVIAVACWFKFSESASAPVADAKPPTLSLTLSADGPNLLVSWIGGIASPKQAHLKIFDGDTVSQIDLMKTYNPTGSLTVPRHSGNVQAVIEVNDGFRNLQSQSSLIDDGFAATKNANAALAAAAKTPQADQPELAKLVEKNRRLQATVDSLRRQLEEAPYRTSKQNRAR